MSGPKESSSSVEKDLKLWVSDVAKSGSPKDVEMFFLGAYRIMLELYEFSKTNGNDGTFMVHANVLMEYIIYDFTHHIMKFMPKLEKISSSTAFQNVKSLTNYRFIKHSNTQKEPVQATDAVCGPEWVLLTDYANTSVSRQANDKKKSNDRSINLQSNWIAIYDLPDYRIKHNIDKILDNVFTTFTKDKKIIEDGEKVVEAYWKNYKDSLYAFSKKNPTPKSFHDALLTQAIETFDLFGMGYLLLSIIGEWRKNFYHSKRALFDDMAQLCMRAIHGNPFERISWIEFLTNYESNCIKNGLDPSKYEPIFNFNTLQIKPGPRYRDIAIWSPAAAPKNRDMETQITRLYKGQGKYNESSTSINFVNQGNETLNWSENKIDIQLLTYIDRTLEHLKVVSYGIYCNCSEDSKTIKQKCYINHNNTTCVLVDITKKIVVVFWQIPNVAWMWSVNSEQNSEDNNNAYANALLDLFFKNSAYNNARLTFDSAKTLIVQFKPNHIVMQMISSLVSEFDVMACTTKIVCMALVPLLRKVSQLNLQVQNIAGLIRDYWAVSLSARINKTVRENDNIQGLNDCDVKEGTDYTFIVEQNWEKFKNLYYKQREQYQNLIKNSTSIKSTIYGNCKNSLPEASWLVRGLAEYCNATLKAIGVPPDFATFAFILNDASYSGYPEGHPLHASENFRNADTEAAYVVIAQGLTINYKKEVYIIMPRVIEYGNVAKHDFRDYVQWFIYKLNFDSNEWTLHVTTPERHANEVAHGFAHHHITNIVAEIQNQLDDTRNVTIIRKPFGKKEREITNMNVFQDDYFSKGTFPSKDVEAWLRGCRDFLINTCNYVHDPMYDERCFCDDKKTCTVLNKSFNDNKT